MKLTTVLGPGFPQSFFSLTMPYEILTVKQLPLYLKSLVYSLPLSAPENIILPEEFSSGILAGMKKDM